MNDDEITKQVILAQTNDCYDGDFLAQTEKDMKNLSITRNYLTSVSKETLKLQQVEKVNEAAFRFLMSKAEKITLTIHLSRINQIPGNFLIVNLRICAIWFRMFTFKPTSCPSSVSV